MDTAETAFLTTTANELVGYRVIRQLGIVQAVVLRSPIISQGFFGAFKMMMGGRNQAYTRICIKVREETLNALIEQARERGANALLAVRYDTTEFLQSATEVMAYGTAVVAQPVAL